MGGPRLRIGGRSSWALRYSSRQGVLGSSERSGPPGTGNPCPGPISLRVVELLLVLGSQDQAVQEHSDERLASEAPPNEEMELTKPDGILAGGHGGHVRGRRAIVFESGFAADRRCCADTGQ